MTLTAKEFSRILQAELDKDYDVVRIARVAFQLYQKHGVELTPDLDEKLLQLIAMEEGPEFEFSQEELKGLVRELAGQILQSIYAIMLKTDDKETVLANQYDTCQL